MYPRTTNPNTRPLTLTQTHKLFLSLSSSATFFKQKVMDGVTSHIHLLFAMMDGCVRCDVNQIMQKKKK